MAGLKNDRKDKKPRWELLPLPLLEQIVNVYTFGAQKYAENSWQDLPDGFEAFNTKMLYGNYFSKAIDNLEKELEQHDRRGKRH